MDSSGNSESSVSSGSSKQGSHSKFHKLAKLQRRKSDLEQKRLRKLLDEYKQKIALAELNLAAAQASGDGTKKTEFTWKEMLEKMLHIQERMIEDRMVLLDLVARYSEDVRRARESALLSDSGLQPCKVQKPTVFMKTPKMPLLTLAYVHKGEWVRGVRQQVKGLFEEDQDRVSFILDSVSREIKNELMVRVDLKSTLLMNC